MPLWQFPPATYHEKQRQYHALVTLQGLVNLPTVYYSNTLFTKKRTSREDFGTSHVSPFIVESAPTLSSMAVSLDVFTAASNEQQEHHQVWWAERSICTMVCWLYLHVERLSMYHYPSESSWVMASLVAHEWTTLCLYQKPWICPFLVLHVSQCVCVFGGVGRGRHTVCLHACCVCMCRILYSRLPGTCKYVAAITSDNFFTQNIRFSLRSLTPFQYPIMCSFLSWSLGKGLSTGTRCTSYLLSFRPQSQEDGS